MILYQMPDLYRKDRVNLGKGDAATMQKPYRINFFSISVSFIRANARFDLDRSSAR